MPYPHSSLLPSGSLLPGGDVVEEPAGSGGGSSSITTGNLDVAHGQVDGVTIRAKSTGTGSAAGLAWVTMSTNDASGIVPENVVLSANEWGSDRASFDLRRDPAIKWPDLAAFTQLEISIDGELVWVGRIKETPSHSGSDELISVQAEGLQYHLDDDVYTKLYVSTKLSAWVDRKSHPATNLNTASPGASGCFPEACSVVNDKGGITLGTPRGVVFPNSSRVGVFFDAGPSQTVKRVVVTYQATPDAGNFQFVLTATDTPFTSEDVYTLDSDPIATTLTTVAQTLTTARRYVTLAMSDSGGSDQTPSQDMAIQISSIKVFSDTAYESGNASNLKASDVVKHARDTATDLDILTRSDNLVSATTDNLPEFAVEDPKTPREVIAAVNVLHNYVTRVTVDRKLQFAAQPTTPKYSIGVGAGYDFQDASLGSGEEIYNKVLVTGQAADGTRMQVTRTQTGTAVDTQGFTRTKIIPVQAALDTTLANKIGDTYLAAHRAQPLRGAVTFTGDVVRSHLEGGSVPAARLLRETTELLWLADMIDPDNGRLGRAGRIASVQYSHDEDRVVVELDETRRDFEQFMERLGVLGAAVA